MKTYRPIFQAFTCFFGLRCLHFVFLRSHWSCLPKPMHYESKDEGYRLLSGDCDPIWYTGIVSILFTIDAILFIFMVRSVSKNGAIQERLVGFLAIPLLALLNAAISFLAIIAYPIGSQRISYNYVFNLLTFVVYMALVPIYHRYEGARRQYYEDRMEANDW